jgi:hypothetical protein
MSENTTNLVALKDISLLANNMEVEFLASRDETGTCIGYIPVMSSLNIPQGNNTATQMFEVAFSKTGNDNDKEFEEVNEGEVLDLHLPAGEKTIREVDTFQYLGRRKCGRKIMKVTTKRYIKEGNILSIDFRRKSKEQEMLSESELRVAQILQESSRIKQGIKICLANLIPYLGRVARISRNEYLKTRQQFWLETEIKLENNSELLSELCQKAAASVSSGRPYLKNLDVVTLKNSILTEISYKKLRKSFGYIDQNIDQIASIRILEKKLYRNYNMIVSSYLNEYKNTSVEQFKKVSSI